jgi:hypothetical protein
VSEPTYRIVGYEADGEEKYELNLAATLLVAYKTLEDSVGDPTYFTSAKARTRLERFVAAVDAKIASDAVMGRKTAIHEAAFALGGGEVLLQKIVRKSGFESALDFVLDNLEEEPR